MTSKDIIEDFPEINEQHIQSCLAYTADREHKNKLYQGKMVALWRWPILGI